METVFFDFPPLPQALNRIADLNDGQFQVLLNAVTGVETFDFSFTRCKRLADQMEAGLSSGDVRNIIRSLLFLKNQFREVEGAEEDPQTALRQLFEFLNLEKYVGESIDARIYQRVIRLISENPVTELYYKNQWLQTGIIDTATDFDSFVDLRPRFSDDMSVEGYVPVVIFRAVIENDRGEEKTCVFQLNEDGIERMQAIFEVINDQISALQAKGVLGISSQAFGSLGGRQEEK